MPGVDLISLLVEMSRRHLGEVRRDRRTRGTERRRGRWRDGEMERWGDGEMER